MDDLMTGIGNSNGMDDISNMNALAQQAAEEADKQAMQASNNAVQTAQQSSDYGNVQSGYGQQSTGYGNAQSGYGQRSTGGSNAQYGQQSSNYSSYDTRSGYPASDTVYGGYGNESKLMPVVKGILGAVLGAIPGIILIILVARMGFIASICGAVMALGIFFGYTMLTKNADLEEKTGLIICAVVMVFAIYFAVRTSWCLEVSSILQDKLGVEAGTLSYEQSEFLYEIIGVRDVSYSDVSADFSTLLEKCDCKGDFIKSLLENIAFAALGGFGMFTKFAGIGSSKI